MPVSLDIQKMVPTFRVRINGADLPSQAAIDVISVEVHEDLNAASMFALRLINWDMFGLRVTWADHQLFSEGNKVEVQMGYVDNIETIITGEITGLEPEFSAEEVPALTVRGYDLRHRLLRGRKTRTFVKVTDSDIITQIAGESDLTANSEDTGVIYDYVLQHNQSDLEFLQNRARRIGYEVFVEDNMLFWRPHRIMMKEEVTLARDADLVEFYPRSSTLSQASSISVRGWNPKSKDKIVGEAKIGDEATTMEGRTIGPAIAEEAFGQAMTASIDRPVLSQAEADQMALGQFNEVALAYIKGQGMCNGRTDLKPGMLIRVEGVGERFGGIYYVTSTRHTYSPQRGYRTGFTVRRNAV